MKQRPMHRIAALITLLALLLTLTACGKPLRPSLMARQALRQLPPQRSRIRSPFPFGNSLVLPTPHR